MQINIKNKLSYAKHAKVKCYMGDHAQCRKHSLAGKGRINNNWVSKSSYLDQIFFITSSSENDTRLHACISKRLSPAVLDRTIKNTNSQKVESFNRTLRRSLPRNVTMLVGRTVQLTLPIMVKAALSELSAQELVHPFPPVALNKY